MSDPAINANRLMELAGAVCNKSASENERAELDAILLADQALCSRYQPFQAVVASIFVNVCGIVDNVLLGLRLTSFLNGVTQWYSVKFSIGLSKRVR